MGQALYRKYRSKSFDEVVGQEHITKTLQAAIKSGKISHAYLFTGPRGVGKTSVARILAHEVNDIPYGGEATHLDIIEIDAASNRRIDEIRDLREKVHVAPTSSKYKVYIIDEVHMLTREAFNALLKTLEEPPAHCIFILATTESHKLPETIISRTQRHNFKAVSPEAAATHLESVAKAEKIVIDKPALDLLAEYGDGSLRDSLSLLDQLSSAGKKIDSQTVRAQLGLPPMESIDKLLEFTFSGNSQELLELLTQLRSEGNEAAIIAKMLAKRLREQLKQGNAANLDTNLLKNLSRISSGASGMDELEIALLEVSSSKQPKAPEARSKPEAELPAEPIAKPKQSQDKAKGVSRASQSSFDLTMWDEVLSELKGRNASLYTALRLASPKIDEDSSLTLAFEFPLHQKKVNVATAKDTITSVIEDVSGAKILIKCVVDKDLVRSLKSEPAADFYKPTDDDKSVQAISNIFGSAEVLES